MVRTIFGLSLKCPPLPLDQCWNMIVRSHDAGMGQHCLMGWGSYPSLATPSSLSLKTAHFLLRIRTYSYRLGSQYTNIRVFQHIMTRILGWRTLKYYNSSQDVWKISKSAIPLNSTLIEDGTRGCLRPDHEAHPFFNNRSLEKLKTTCAKIHSCVNVLKRPTLEQFFRRPVRREEDNIVTEMSVERLV